MRYEEARSLRKGDMVRRTDEPNSVPVVVTKFLPVQDSGKHLQVISIAGLIGTVDEREYTAVSRNLRRRRYGNR
jgi:hypothetical protein